MLEISICRKWPILHLTNLQVLGQLLPIQAAGKKKGVGGRCVCVGGGEGWDKKESTLGKSMSTNNKTHHYTICFIYNFRFSFWLQIKKSEIETNECLNNLAMLRPLRPNKLLNRAINEGSEPCSRGLSPRRTWKQGFKIFAFQVSAERFCFFFGYHLCAAEVFYHKRMNCRAKRFHYRSEKGLNTPFKERV